MPGASKCQPAYYCQLFRICSIFLHFLGEKNSEEQIGVSARQRVHRHLQASWVAGSKDQALACRALFCPSQYKNAPTAINTPVAPTTFAIASTGSATWTQVPACHKNTKTAAQTACRIRAT